MTIIVDGTGQGTRAAVTKENRLRVDAVSENAYAHSAQRGKAFTINTKTILYSGTAPFQQSILHVHNHGTDDVELTSFFVGESVRGGQGGLTDPILLELYGNPAGTPTGNQLDIVNQRVGDPTPFNITATVDPIGLTVSPSGPLLHQYHYSGRAHDDLNITLPSNQSILVMASFPSSLVGIYLGFNGYVRG